MAGASKVRSDFFMGSNAMFDLYFGFFNHQRWRSFVLYVTDFRLSNGVLYHFGADNVKNWVDDSTYIQQLCTK